MRPWLPSGNQHGQRRVFRKRLLFLRQFVPHMLAAALCSCAKCLWVRTSSSHRLSPPHLPTASRPSLIHNDRHAAFVFGVAIDLIAGQSHDMQGKRQTGCQQQPNFDLHVSNAEVTLEAQEIVVFEPAQVLPIYRIIV
jgi:hypothetical protein